MEKYKEERLTKVFSDIECQQFKNRFMIACTISDVGALWCHICGPLRVIMHESLRVWRKSRLFPIDGKKLLICEICFAQRKFDVSLEKECIKLCKSIDYQIKVWDVKCDCNICQQISIDPATKEQFDEQIEESPFFSFIAKLATLQNDTSEIPCNFAIWIHHF